MKLAFLCSSLAAGRDGVGDYTRGLARELTAAGHRCLLLSLNDPEAALESETVLRLSGAASWASRMERARAALREFHPDWVSLQLSCYGFHPRGLIFSLVPQLTSLFEPDRAHVMLHELWIGESAGYTWKERVIGWAQKRGILRLLRAVQPSVMHTSNPVYREVLRRNKLSARELPLPGNIPVLAAVPGGLEIMLREHGWPLDGFSREAWWVGGVFGTIHPEWSPARFLDGLCALAGERRKRLLLLHLGRTPEVGAAVWQQLAKTCAGRCELFALGPQPAAGLSTALQALDFGIATSPWALIGKSGSAAAMLDHGLPVAVPHEDWKLRRGATPEPTAHPLLFRADDFLEGWRSGSIKRRVPHSRTGSIAEQLLRDLAAVAFPR